MKVRRSYEKEVKKFQVGDQIKVGKYTATVVKVENKIATFLLDQYLDKAFSHVNMLDQLNAYLLKDENFKEIMPYVKPCDPCNDGSHLFYRVPFAGEMFSGTSEDQWMRENYLPDTEDGFLDIWPCMKDRRNRIADRKGQDYEWGWLMNRTNWSTAYFAYVSSHGSASYADASYSIGVRPVFQIEIAE